MRQTVIKDGIQSRLQDLLGSQYNNSDKYSIQSSMMENLTRVCKAIVGNNTNGKVMSGMLINKENGSVSDGYAITPSGKVIKFGTIRGGGQTPLPSTRLNVYAVHIDGEVAAWNATTAPDNTGYSFPVIRGGDTLIIRDQLGSSSNTSDDASLCVQYNTGSIQLPNTDSVYIGTIITDADGMTRSVVYPQINNSDVQYVYNGSVSSVAMWTGTTTMASPNGVLDDSMIMIDPGKNNLKKLRLVLRNRTTSFAPRTGTSPESYKIRIQYYQYGINRTSIGSSINEYSLSDFTEPSKSFEFDINELLDNNCGYLGISATATTASFDTSVTSGYADIQYIIEKLN